MITLSYSLADQNVATTKSIGIYNFSVNLVKTLSRDPGLKLRILSNSTIDLKNDLGTNAYITEHDSAFRSRLGRIVWDQYGVYAAARAANCGWLFLPKGFCSFVQRPTTRVAAYVHDIMGDFYQRHYPRFVSRLESEYFARSLAATAASADVIFTNTEFTKGEISRLFSRRGARLPKIVVAGYGFDQAEHAPREKQDRILLLTSDLPHKQTSVAVHLLDLWALNANYQGTIDCVGSRSQAAEVSSRLNWNWVGRVVPAETIEMMRKARVVIYTSEYEGFGMPPVEAVVAGTAPVFSDIPPHREVMGECGYSFSNGQADSFAQAMDAALNVPASKLEEWSRSLLNRHNWNNVANKIIDELR